jgi:hypothetical protein
MHCVEVRNKLLSVLEELGYIVLRLVPDNDDCFVGYTLALDVVSHLLNEGSPFTIQNFRNTELEADRSY